MCQHRNVDARDSDIEMLSVRLCVCLSHSDRDTLTYIIIPTAAYGNAIVLVFQRTTERHCVIPTGSLLAGRWGVYKFRDCPPISGFISETIQDSAIVTIEC